MYFKTKNGKEIQLQKWHIEDLERLLDYLIELSPETKKRFAPHHFDLETLHLLFQKSDEYIGYTAKHLSENKIIAYSIAKVGVLPKDGERLSSYGLKINPFSTMTLAPSVADAWQSEGVGSLLMNFILSKIDSPFRISRIVLWGGVQNTNTQALHFYQKHGFVTVGQFERNGSNSDMILDL